MYRAEGDGGWMSSFLGVWAKWLSNQTGSVGCPYGTRPIGVGARSSCAALSDMKVCFSLGLKQWYFQGNAPACNSLPMTVQQCITTWTRQKLAMWVWMQNYIPLRRQPIYPPPILNWFCNYVQHSTPTRSSQIIASWCTPGILLGDSLFDAILACPIWTHERVKCATCKADFSICICWSNRVTQSRLHCFVSGLYVSVVSSTSGPPGLLH